MNMLQTVGPWVLELAVIFIFCLVLIMVVANAQWQFTRIEKGNTAFIVKGDDLKVMLPNVDGHRVSKEKDLEGRRWLVKVNVSKDPKAQKKEMHEAFERPLQPGTKWLQWVLWNKLGIRFVSWLYPQIRVHKIHISMNRLREGKKDGEGVNLQNRIEPDEGDIDSLRFLVPRPLVVKGVELAGDNARLDILVLAVFRTVIPALPVFYYKGKFMSLLDADISSGIIDFCATYQMPVTVNEKGEYDPRGKNKGFSSLTYEHWLRLSKGKGSPIQDYLRKLNASPEFYEALERENKTDLLAHLEVLLGGKPEPLPSTLKGFSGFIPKLGFALESIEVIDWTATEETKELSTALRSKQTKLHTAEGVRQESYGKRDSIEAIGRADAARIGQMVEAVVVSLAGREVPPDQIAEVIKSIFQAEQLKQIPNLQTLILGNTNATAMVSTQMPTPPRPANP